MACGNPPGSPGPGGCNQLYLARVGNPARYPSRLASRGSEFPSFPVPNRPSRRNERRRMPRILPHGISTGIHCIRHLQRSAQYSPPPRGHFVARFGSPSGPGGSARRGWLLRAPVELSHIAAPVICEVGGKIGREAEAYFRGDAGAIGHLSILPPVSMGMTGAKYGKRLEGSYTSQLR